MLSAFPAGSIENGPAWLNLAGMTKIIKEFSCFKDKMFVLVGDSGVTYGCVMLQSVLYPFCCSYLIPNYMHHSFTTVFLAAWLFILSTSPNLVPLGGSVASGSDGSFALESPSASVLTPASPLTLQDAQALRLRTQWVDTRFWVSPTVHEPIFITLKNAGTDPVSNVRVSYAINGGAWTAQETVFVQIAPGDTFRYQFQALANLTPAGIFSLKAATTLTGDTNSSNDTTQLTGIEAYLPHSATIPLGPYNFNVTPSAPDGFPVEWDSGYEPNMMGLSQSQQAVPMPGNLWLNDLFGFSVSHPFGNALRGLGGQEGWVMTPEFVAQSATVVKFDMAQINYLNNAYAPFNPGEILSLGVSTNSGNTFSTLYQFVNGDIAASGTNFTFPIGAYAGQKIRVGFYAYQPAPNSAPSIFLDNVHIYNLPVPTDIEVMSVLVPNQLYNGCGMSAAQVKVVVRNNSVTPATGMTYDYQINGGNYSAPVTLPQTIAPVSTDTLILPGTFDFTTLGTTTFKVRVNIPNDGAPANNFKSVAMTIRNPATSAMTLNFSSYNGNAAATYPGWRESNSWWPDVVPGNPGGGWDTSPLFGDSIAEPCMRFTGWSIAHAAWFISPSYQVQAGDVIAFDAIGADWFSGPVSLNFKVLYSLDCGTTFNLLQAYNSLSRTGTREILSLNQFAGDEIQLALYAEYPNYGSLGWDVYVDNLHIGPNNFLDVASTEVLLSDIALMGCGTASETIGMVVKNLSATVAANQVSVSYKLNGVAGGTPVVVPSIAPLQSDTVFFPVLADLSFPINHTIEVKATCPQCIIPANDVLSRNVRSVTSFQADTLLQDFQQYNGTNTFPGSSGWREGDGTFLRPLPGEEGDWGAAGFSFNQGGSSVAMFHYNHQNKTGWIFSPPVLSGDSSVLSFDVAMYNYSSVAYPLSATDSFIVGVSSNCSASIIPLAIYSGGHMFSITGEKVFLDLNAFPNQEIIIGFYASSWAGGSPNTGIVLDNVLFSKEIRTDLRATKVIGPAVSYNLSANEQIGAVVQNAGDSQIDSAFVSVSVNNSPFSVPDTFLVNILQSQKDTLILPNGMDFSVPGVYTVKIVARCPGDTNALNDTVSRVFYSVPYSNAAPSVDNFEQGGFGWLVQGSNPSWARGLPAKAVINGAASGSHAWVAGGLTTGSTYNPSERSYLVSPVYDFSQTPADMWVGMRIWWETEGGKDGAILEFSIDGGSYWVRLGTLGSGVNWYNTPHIAGLGNINRPGWSGASTDLVPKGSGGWVFARHLLPQIVYGSSAVRFRFVFGANSSVQKEGFAVDDFSFGYLPVISGLAPDSTYCSGQTLQAGSPVNSYLWSTGDTTPAIQLINPGSLPILDSVISVTVTDTLGFSAAQTINVSIRPEPMLDAIVQKEVSCYGAADARLVALAQGNGALTYEWATNPPQHTDSLAGVGPGVYAVTVTDGWGCTTTDSVTVTQPDSLLWQLVAVEAVDCYGGNNGQIEMMASGGTPPYAVQWSNQDTSLLISGLVAGTYTALVTDGRGCVKLDSVTVTQPDSLHWQLVAAEPADCKDGNNGQIEIAVSGGTPPYTTRWSNLDSTFVTSGLEPGTYSAVIRDGNQCVVLTSDVVVSYRDSLPEASFAFQHNGLEVTFENTSVNAATYLWDFGDGAGVSTLAAPVYTFASADSFLVTLYSTNACGTDTAFQWVNLSTVGMDPEQNARFRIFPNPAGNQVWVELNWMGFQQATISVYNTLGQLSLQVTGPAASGQVTMDVSSLPDGLYVVKVDADGRAAGSRRLQVLKK